MLGIVALVTSVLTFSHLTGEPSPLDLSRERVLILGDSNTMAGDYVSFLEYSLLMANPNKHFDIISVGLASETASGLSESVHPFPRPCVHERLWAALDIVKPTAVIACYGINDGIYHPLEEGRMNAFKSGIRKLIEIDRACGAKTILLTPPPFDARAAGDSVRPATASDFSWMNAYDQYDSVMKAYGEWEMSLADKDVVVIDIHKPITSYVERARNIDPKFALSGDGVHINPLGHWLLALGILDGLHLKPYNAPHSIDAPKLPAVERFPQATSLQAILKDPVFALVDKRRRLRSDAWLNYIGYVREKAFKTHSVQEAEKRCKDLQRQIDQARRVTFRP